MGGILKYDLEGRLIKFTVSVHQLMKKMPSDFGSKVLLERRLRSSASPALNYGEAQGAESDKDFLHEMQICLKELRESQIRLKVIEKVPHLNDASLDELIKNQVN